MKTNFKATLALKILLVCLTFSALLHLILYKTLGTIQSSLATQTEQVSIQFLEKKSKDLKTARIKHPSKLQRPHQTTNIRKLKSLLPRYTFKPSIHNQKNNKENHQYNTLPEKDQSFSETINIIGTEQANSMMPFFEEIWKKVDHSIEYPDDFAKQRIEGTVNIIIHLDENGAFTGQFRTASSSDPLLETYIITTLAHILRDPIPKPYRLKTKTIIPVAMSFRFSVHNTRGHYPVANHFQHLKNTMIFNKEKYVDPRVVEIVNKLYARYAPPIIPIPGGFIIDFIRAYEIIQNIGTSDPDELRAKRLQTLKLRLQKTVKHMELKSQKMAKETTD